MKMNDESYYRALGVVDRIRDEAIKKFGNLSKFSKSCGKKPQWFYSVYVSGNGISLNTLFICAEALNLSVEYLLTGRRKKLFSALKIDIKDIFNDIHNMPIGFRMIKSKIKTGKTKDIRLQTLFSLERLSNKDVTFLLKI